MLDTVAGLEIDGATVLDLFAGSGAMGIEALSRGARTVVFVDRAPGSVKVVRANLATLGLEEIDLDARDVEVVRAEAVGWLLARPRHFDLALVDPPYAFSEWGTLLGRLDAAVAVLESDRELAAPVTWGILKRKRYGDTLVTVVRHVDPARAGQKGSP